MPQMLVDGKTTQIDAHGNCPECGSSWDAGSVFDNLRKQPHYVGKNDDELRAHIAESYGDANKRFSRLIGIEIRGYYDGVCKWKCPDCKTEWDRFARR